MLAHALKKVRDGLVSLAYPEQCRVCADAVEAFDDGVACQKCWTDPAITPLIAGRVCRKCGIPLPATSSANHFGDCGSCDSFPFSAARASALYGGAIEASILDMKSRPRLPGRLREIILETYRERSNELVADLVIPIPLHKSREQERGFNQARLIANLIARRNRLELSDSLLIRVKRTERHRAGLDATDRAKSAERAFEVKRPEIIKGASILLADDLFTTGSTLSAAAKALLDKGAARVNVITIARVARSSPIAIQDSLARMNEVPHAEP